MPAGRVPSHLHHGGYKTLTSSSDYWQKAAQPPELSVHEVHAWAVPVDVSPRNYGEVLSLLAPDERKRADTFRMELPRRQFVVARGTLRRLLSQYLRIQPKGVELTVDENNKPQLAGRDAETGLRFNVSHSGELALIAVARGCEVGVDIEHLREVRHLEQIARRFFHPAEAHFVLNERGELQMATFFRCWTAKEAVLKAIGVGVLGPLTGFQVPIIQSDASWVKCDTARSDQPAVRCWLQRLEPLEGYAAAVVSVGSERQVRCFTYWNMD
jgi:4'-phosphopantetheinyl transferase